MSKVTVYTSSTCPWCVRAKKYLNSIGVSYKEVNVAKDFRGAVEMMKKSGQRGVPVLDINGNIVIGFDKEQIDSLLRG